MNYKIINVNKNGNSFMILFAGKNHKSIKLKYESTPEDIFSKRELDDIKRYNTKIHFSEHSIHSDDSLGIIRLKFIDSLKKILLKDISIEELYFFYERETKIDPSIVYQQGKGERIGKVMLSNIFKNIVSKNKLNVTDKELYDYNDIVSLFKEEENTQAYKILSTTNKISSTIVNPFHVESYNHDFEKNKYIRSAHINNLLFEFGEIENETLYVCFANDVFEFMNEKGLSINYTVQNYFPLLNWINISTIDELNKKSSELVIQTNNLLSKLPQNTEVIDELYDMKGTSSVKKGITELKIIIKSDINIIFPLETLFKKFQSSIDIPLVKYNSTSKKQEPIFRLYSEVFSDNGTKVPYLHKSLILKLDKIMAKNPSVSIYQIVDYADTSYQIIYEWNPNGNITVSWFNDKQIVIENYKIFNDIILLGLNNIYSKIDFLSQRISFDKISDDGVEIINLTFQLTYGLEKKFVPKDLGSCLTNVFITDDSKTMRYRRVSNFDNRTSQEALIIKKINQYIPSDEIINELQQIFNISSDEATAKYNDVVSEFKLDDRRFLRYKIPVDPGFKTTFDTYGGINQMMDIKISGINNIKYLDLIPNYTDVLVKISQDKKGISKLCSSKKTKKEEIVFNVKDVIDDEVEEAEEVGQKEDKIQDLLDLLGDSEDDDDDEFDLITGGNKLSELEEKVIGTKLKNTNYFQDRIEKKVPQLFETPTDKRYTSYSRMCQSSSRIQPVILSKDEKDKILKDSSKDIIEESDILEYKYSENDPSYYYMCPQYWCMLTDSFVTKEDIMAGKCGKKTNDINELIIPEKATKVPKDKYVYQFYDDTVGKRYPGYHKKKNQQGKCVPCCYKIFNKANSLKNQKECNPGSSKSIEKKDKDEDSEQYIIGPDKYPIESDRWGFLPYSVQLFLEDVQKSMNSQDIIRGKNMKLFMRRGIEHHSSQSFIGCISNMIYYLDKSRDNIPSIKEMKQIIKGSIDLDTYTSLQNGNLIDVFYDENKKNNKEDINRYKNTKVYKDDSNIIERIINSYENFLKYLDDDKVVIDHTWLWDLISIPNTSLFKDGINLVILEVLNNDSTNNVNIICPTNIFSTNKYSSWKQTMIVIKQDNYYEPIYYFNKKSKQITVEKSFNELSSTLNNVIVKRIKPILESSCGPKGFNSKIYTFTQPDSLSDTIEQLKSRSYTILKQVVNFQGKVIGMFAKDENGYTGIIPCYPSNMNKKYESINMTNTNLWQPYNKTLIFLENYYNNSEKIYKVHEDGMVIGFLTKSNQFIQISKPIELNKVNDDLESINMGNSIDADINTKNNKKVDDERTSFVNKMKLELFMYNSFRLILKEKINDYSNIKTREQLFNVITKKYTLFTDQLNETKKILENVLEDVSFVDTDINDLIELEKVIKNKKIFLKKSLINRSNNKNTYISKLSDELIRYSNIRNFIFNPSHLLVDNGEYTTYNIHENEIILFHHILTQDFFNNLNPTHLNKYEKIIPYDTAGPNISEELTIEKEVQETIENIPKTKNYEKCTPHPKRSIMSTHWVKIFPKKYQETMYFGKNNCGLYLISDLYSKIFNENMSVSQIKNKLMNFYKKITNNFTDVHIIQKIVDILIDNGNLDVHKSVTVDGNNLEDYLIQDTYFISNIDLWILMNELKIPSILISGKKLILTNSEFKGIIMYKDKETSSSKFVYILSPTFDSKSKVPRYKYIENDKSDVMIEYIDNGDIEPIKNYMDISDYITNYVNRRKKFVIRNEEDI